MSSFGHWAIATIFLSLTVRASRANSIELGSDKRIALAITDIDGERAFVENVTIFLQYDKSDLSVYKYPRTEAVNFLMNCTISFAADILRSSEQWIPHRESDSFAAVVLGRAKLFVLTEEYYSLVECESYLPKGRKHEGMFGVLLRNEIISLINYIMAAEICKEIKEISFNEVIDQSTHLYDFGTISVMKGLDKKGEIGPISGSDLSTFIYDNIVSKQSSTRQHGLRVEFNGLVDFVIAKVVDVFRKTNNGRIKIPDIYVTFSNGPYYTPQGNIHATGGTFSDVTTLTRTSDVRVTNSGSKWTVSCGFGLSLAIVDYPYYEFTYGYTLASGSLRVSIRGVSFKTTIVVDCNRRPGRVTLQKLDLPTLGDIDVAVTGLYFNNILSYLVSYLGDTWKYEIAALVLGEIKKVIQHEIDKLSCGLSHG